MTHAEREGRLQSLLDRQYARLSAAPDWRLLQVGRAFLAVALLVTLWATPWQALFRLDRCAPIWGGGLFCQFDEQIARPIATVALLAAASGYVPLLISIGHWWVAFSFYHSSSLFEGGDQLAMIVSLLLIGVCSGRPLTNLFTRPSGNIGDVRMVLVNLCLLVCSLQLCYLYLQAGLSKFWVEEWVNGSALWYILYEPTFGFGVALPGWAVELLASAAVVAVLTGVPMLVELFIGVSQLGDRKARQCGVVLGVLLHVGIALVMGIVAFAFVMIGSLTISAARGRLPDSTRQGRAESIACEHIACSAPLQ